MQSYITANHDILLILGNLGLLKDILTPKGKAFCPVIEIIDPLYLYTFVKWITGHSCPCSTRLGLNVTE